MIPATIKTLLEQKLCLDHVFLCLLQRKYCVVFYSIKIASYFRNRHCHFPKEAQYCQYFIVIFISIFAPKPRVQGPSPCAPASEKTA